MRTINTVKGFKAGTFILAFCAFCVLSGCAQRSASEEAKSETPPAGLQQAEDSAKKSQEYYRRAIAEYGELLKKGQDAERIHLELGRLYYGQGDFTRAIEEFRQLEGAEAKRLLAIAYYRKGDLSDALEIFSKEDIPDDEYRYYHGLTCEKLNLFDQALDVYSRVKGKELAPLAAERRNIIEKQVRLRNVKEIDPEVAKILDSAPNQEAYPQAGALVLYCDERTQISASGTQVTELHYIVKILNERGKESFSESSIDYDSTYEKVELAYARTLRPDGAVLEVGTRHIRDVSKYMNFPLYSNARAYIISFPGITEGASIEYKVRIYRSQLMNKKDFIMSYPVQASEPVLSANFAVDLPKEKKLYLKTINEKYNTFGANLRPEIKERSGRLVYSWSFKNIPQIMPEANMPSNVEVNPAILLSTFGAWQEIYDWWWALAKEKMQADPAIKGKVVELIRNQGSGEAKARAIYNFCAQKIRYVAVEYGQAGYEPHAAADIFKNRYGDCKDQAILLVTMLKEAGFSAWPVLIPTRECYNLSADFPSALFNHCIAAVALNGQVVFMDPTAETCSFDDLPDGDQGRQVLVFKEDGYKIEPTPLYPAAHNLLKQYLNIKINPDETISAERSVSTAGIYEQAQRYWLLYTPPELVEETLKEKIQEVSIGSRLSQYRVKNLGDLNTPVGFSYTFAGPEYFTHAGALRIMPQLASLDTSLAAKDKRRYPVDFTVMDIKETVFEIELPPNFVVKYMPQSISEDNRWMKFSVQYLRENNKINFTQRVELKKKVIPEEDYAEFKSFFEGLAKKIKQRVILEKAGNT